MTRHKNKPQYKASEWQEFINVEDVTTSPTRKTITADEAQRAEIAGRVEVQSIEALRAELTLTRENKMTIHVGGELHAKLTQTCVKTLDPVLQEFSYPFDAWYADQEQVVPFSRAKAEREEKNDGERPMLEEFEDPEPVIDGQINLGELVIQHLSLAIDPYPLAEGVERADDEEESIYKDETDNPFAALKELRRSQDE